MTLFILMKGSSNIKSIISNRRLITFSYLCLFIAGTVSGYYGFLLGQSALAYLTTPVHNDFEIPSHAISNAYLIESIIEELPEVDLYKNSTSANHGSSIFVAQSDTSKSNEPTGMGGAVGLGRVLLSSNSSSLKSASSLINKIRPEQRRLRDFKYIDSMQKKISRIPIGSPAIGQITSHYGRRLSPFKAGKRDLHTGIDIAVDEGTPVYASADGEILLAEHRRGYGKAIQIKHPSGYETLYAHLSSILVEEGQLVCRGQQIGHVGTTGRSTGPHLHYEVRENGSPIDPSPFIELAHVLRFAK